MDRLTPSGLAWRNHFRSSLAGELNPPMQDSWTPAEATLLAPSLAQFQLGESSDGRHLLQYARQFGEASGDVWLGEAMALFIQEENRHSHWLGEFLRAQNEPLIKACWSDGVFRILRKLLGFGLMVAVLVCAEIVAVPYYSAVRQHTSSRWLRAICSRLLHDEAIHLRFQASNLAAVWRRWGITRLFRGVHKLFMAATCFVVWLDHGAVLRAGGYTPLSFLSHCLDLLREVHQSAAAAAAPSVDGTRLARVQ